MAADSTQSELKEHLKGKKQKKREVTKKKKKKVLSGLDYYYKIDTRSCVKNLVSNLVSNLVTIIKMNNYSIIK